MELPRVAPTHAGPRMGWRKAGLALALWLHSASAWAMPSVHEQAQLREAAYFQGPQALQTQLARLEQHTDLSNWPTVHFYRALIAKNAQQPTQALQHLHQALPDLQQQFQAQPSRLHAEALAAALQLQGQLHDEMSERAARDAAFAQAVAVADQGLPPEAPLHAWLRFQQMLHAVDAQQWPRASGLFEQLVRGLPVPLEQCEESLCWQLRFQQQRLAEGLKYTTAQRRALLKALVIDLQRSPFAPMPTLMWAQYMQINDALHHEEWAELEQLCRSLPNSSDVQHHDSAHPELRNAWRQARGLCAEGLREGYEAFAQLLQQEAAAHGLATLSYGNLLLRQTDAAVARADWASAARAASQAWAVGWARDSDYLLQQSHYHLAYLMADQHRLPEAIFHAKLSVQARRSVLQNAQTLSEEHARALLEDDADLYDDLGQWLLQQGRLPEAERALALARERSYHRVVRSTRPTLLEMPLNPQERQRLQALQPLQQQLHAAWRQRESTPQALAHLLPALTPTLDAPLTQRPLAPATATTTPALADAHHASGLAGTPAQHPAAAPAAHTEVYLLPGRQQLHAVVRRAGQAPLHLSLPMAEADLVRHIARLRQQLQQPGSHILPLAQQLYRAIWAPLAAHLPAPQPHAAIGHAPTVHLQLEGVLRYMPLALLHDGQHWLGESYALALLGHASAGSAPPAAAAAATAAPARQGWALLGSGAGTQDLPPLPLVAQELRDIAQHAQQHAIPHQVLLEQQFTAANLAQALSTQRVVHLASHFRLAPGDGAASGLVLGDGQLLSLQRLEQSPLQWQGLDLLTLSACETAVPTGSGSDGLSIDSLAWLAQAKGAKHVLASLWAVSDHGTQPFMERFYAALAQGVPHAQSVRAAQLALLRSPTAAASNPETDLRHPYFWSAFVLLGPGREQLQLADLQAQD